MNTISNHKNIVKSTSIFGFVQVLRLVIRIVSNKFISLFLGPSGIGLIGLFENTILLISSLTSLGISTTGVREVALAENNPEQEAEIIAVLNKWSIILGFFGAIVTVLFSGFLSILVFGSSDKYYLFMLLSVSFFFSAFSSTRAAILQGKRKLKLIVISNIIASFFIAISSLTLYYFYRIDAIVYVLLVSSFITFVVNIAVTRTLAKSQYSISFRTAFLKGQRLIKLGFLLSINVIFGQVCFYIIRVFLNFADASNETLGFYETNNVLLVAYLGMVFSAMSNDYYPSLTAIIDEQNEFVKLVNDQVEIAILIVTPAIIFMYLADVYIIKILYSDKFLPVIEILKISLFSLILRAIAWPLGFIALAKGNNREYFKQNVMSDGLNILLTILFYSLFGLQGIGIALVLNTLVFLVYLLIFAKRAYAFQFNYSVKKVIFICLTLGILAFGSKMIFNSKFQYFILGILFVFSALYSLLLIKKRIKSKV